MEKKVTFMNKDLFSGICLFLFSIFVIFASINIEVLLPPQAGMLHPGFMPGLVAILIAILSLSLVISSFRSAHSDAEEKKAGKLLDVREFKSVSFPSFCVILYYLLLPVMGFFVCTMLFTLILFRFTKALSWPMTIGMSLIITLGTYLFFSKVLQVQFPAGFFF